MKYTKLFVFGFALLGLVNTSCDDAINIKQPGERNDPDAVYTNLDELQKGLNGVYQVFSTESTIGFTSIFTDEVAIGINNGGQGIIDGLYQFNLNAGTDYARSIWQNNYILINFANRILVAADKLRPAIDELGESTDPEDQDEYYNQDLQWNGIVGQLKAMRAFAHFQLVNWFSTDPSSDSALGAMLLDFVPDDNYNTFLPRVTNGELYTFINSDLDDATVLLQNFSTDKNFAGTNFITALRARIAITRKQYTEAYTYANQALTASAVVANTLAAVSNTPTTYFDLLTDTSQGESIFKLTRVNGGIQIGSTWYSQSSSLNGSPFYEVSRALFNAYDYGDVRNDAKTLVTVGGQSVQRTGTPAFGTLVDPTSRISQDPDSEPNYAQSDVLVVNRYPGKTGEGDPLLNDIKVFSIGEMLLIKAEAAAMLGNLNGGVNTAKGVMVRLKSRRLGGTATASTTSFTQPDYADAAEALLDIFKERRKELSFFGHRYLDIKRLGPVVGLGIERYSLDCNSYGACTLDASNYRFTLPIPNSEITANPAIRGQQNPGY